MQVDEAVKTERLHRLQALLNGQQRAFNEAQIGNVLPVLFDKPSKKSGQMSGRSPYLQTVHVTMDEAIMDSVRGRILPVAITAAHNNSLSGHLSDGD
jgi:tRNA-2-methylthio-N6-dimethylallyladenosine synthase